MNAQFVTHPSKEEIRQMAILKAKERVRECHAEVLRAEAEQRAANGRLMNCTKSFDAALSALTDMALQQSSVEEPE